MYEIVGVVRLTWMMLQKTHLGFSSMELFTCASVPPISVPFVGAGLVSASTFDHDLLERDVIGLDR
jgi:hypothetical protein